MANWCSNSVAFEGNNTALEQVRLEFIKMQLRENKEKRWTTSRVYFR